MEKLDEQNFGHKTRTRVWDVSDLDRPTVHRVFDGTTTARDRRAQLPGQLPSRAAVIAATDPATTALSEVGYFDIDPPDDAAEFNGALSNYPFFASGVVAVSGIEQGLFVLRPTLSAS